MTGRCLQLGFPKVPKSKRLQQFPCCERAQRGIKTSAVGSFRTLAARRTNNRCAGRSVNSLRLRRRLLLCVLRTFTLDCKQVAHQQRRRPRFKRIVFPIFHRLPSAKPEVLFEPAHSDVSSRCRSEAIPCHPFATQQFRCRKRKAKASAVSLAVRKKCLSETK